MKLSEHIKSTSSPSGEDLTLWYNKAEELETLLLRARDELEKFSNVLIHPSARSIVAKRDMAFMELDTRFRLSQRQVDLYKQTTEALQQRIRYLEKQRDE